MKRGGCPRWRCLLGPSAVGLVLAGCAAELAPLMHWRTSGQNADHFELWQDRTIVTEGAGSLMLRPGPLATDSSSGSALQVVDAAGYAGQRVRLSGFYRAEPLGEAPFSGNVFVRLDGEIDGERVRLGFSSPEVVRTKTEWTPFEMTMDVVDGSRVIVFGAAVTGRATFWLDGFSFEVVPRTMEFPVTVAQELIRRGTPFPAVPADRLFAQPSNLDFETPGEWLQR